jgi:hypothetical protein
MSDTTIGQLLMYSMRANPWIYYESVLSVVPEPAAVSK